MKRTVFVVMLLMALVGCSGFGQPTHQPLPTVVLNGGATPAPQGTGALNSGGIIASGIVVPAQQAQLVSPVGGSVKSVTALQGGSVKAGQVLISLSGSEKQAAAVAAANLELVMAQQTLADLNEQAAQAGALAQKALADADKALKEAQDNRFRKSLARVTQATIDRAQADLIITKDSLKSERDNFAKFETRPADDVGRAQAFSALSAVQQKVDQAQWNLDWLLSRPDTLEVQQADADIAVATARQAAAQRQFDKLKQGPDPAALALTRARIDNAQAQVGAAQAALADLEVKAPFNGTVIWVAIHSGEWLTPGLPVITLADVEALRVETTDLSERDVPQVKVGQAVSVRVNALNQTVAGKVSQIASLADSLGGDVVYKTTIELASLPPGLRAGMTVAVQFGN